MKKEVFDIKGNKVEEINLSDSVFNIEPNEEAIKQYVRVYRANQRQGTSSTKTRGEVSGSGKKPWQQKKTGRARVGEKRNPLWTGGGIALGPKPKSWNLKIPKKLRKLVFKSVLSIKFKEKKSILIDKVEFKNPKTSEMLEVMNNFKIRGKTLLVIDKVDRNVIKSGSNIKNFSTAFVDELNSYQVIINKNLILTKDSAKKLEERYKK